MEKRSRMLTYEETSKILGLKLNTLYSMVFRKEIPHKRLTPRLVRFDEKELRAWLRDCSVPEYGKQFLR